MKQHRFNLHAGILLMSAFFSCSLYAQTQLFILQPAAPAQSETLSQLPNYSFQNVSINVAALHGPVGGKILINVLGASVEAVFEKAITPTTNDSSRVF